jgi:hypothetical protein
VLARNVIAQMHPSWSPAMRIASRTLVLSAALGFAGAAFAQQPSPPPAAQAGVAAGPEIPSVPPAEPAPAVAPATAPTLTGRLQRWLVNPNGEVDGLLLADGTQVNLPPHLSADLPQAARPGDTVQVQGWRMPGAPVLRALRLTAGGRTVEDAPPAPGNAPPVPPEPAALTAMSASGRVERLLYTPRGDANGVLLDDGSIVRFPPHVGTALAAALRPGRPLFARGWGSRNPQGSALAATALGPSEDSARELFAGPGVEPMPAPRGARPPRAPRGPSAFPGAPDAPPAGTAPPPPQS